MHFLVIDTRFGAPVHVFLEHDPRAHPGFPGFDVRAVDLETPLGPDGEPPRWSGAGYCPTSSVGQHPWRADRYREFGSDRAVVGAGFVLVEPRYVGPSWSDYVNAYRPEGGKLLRRPRLPSLPVPRSER
jgi:hypothetical protein